jgi:hypothetical protein
MVDISVQADGLKAADAVELVTKPLEAIVKGIDGIEHVYSQTQDDRALVTARLRWSATLELSGHDTTGHDERMAMSQRARRSMGSTAEGTKAKHDHANSNNSASKMPTPPKMRRCHCAPLSGCTLTSPVGVSSAASCMSLKCGKGRRVATAFA